MPPCCPTDAAARRPVLVADIGGTNTRLALARDGVLVPGTLRRYSNAEFRDPEALLRHYHATVARPDLAGACAALAGPVRDGTGTLTNLGWSISEAALAAWLGTGRARLLNDLEAQGHALDRLAPAALRQVRPGSARPGAPRLVIGVGTGFNAASIHRLRDRGRLVAASECGHASLPTPTPEDRRLAAHLGRTRGFASIEEALSGRGLAAIDAWLAQRGGGQPGRDAGDVLEAIGTGDPRAVRAAAIFVRLLGTVAGDLALVHLPFGGIFLIGGMARAMAPHLERFGFAAAFTGKGRLAPLMAEFPLTVIGDDYTALTGCAVHLAEDGA